MVKAKEGDWEHLHGNEYTREQMTFFPVCHQRSNIVLMLTIITAMTTFLVDAVTLTKDDCDCFHL